MLQTPQNEGYKKFFTNKKMHEPIIAMKFAKQTAKLNRYSSNLEAVDIINEDFFSGPFPLEGLILLKTRITVIMI